MEEFSNSNVEAAWTNGSEFEIWDKGQSPCPGFLGASLSSPWAYLTSSRISILSLPDSKIYAARKLFSAFYSLHLLKWMLSVLFIQTHKPGCPLVAQLLSLEKILRLHTDPLGEKRSELVTEVLCITSKDIAESYLAAQPQKELERMKDDHLRAMGGVFFLPSFRVNVLPLTCLW